MMRVVRRTHLPVALMMLALLVLAAVIPGSVAAQEDPNPLVPSDPPLAPTRDPSSEMMPGRIIVKYEEGANPAEEAAVRRQEDLDKVNELGLIRAEVLEVQGRSTRAALRDLNRRPDVEYAEPDFIYHPSGYTDEPRFGELWGLDNTGQAVNGSPGTTDVDVNGKEASGVTLGDPGLVVAVIDTGVDFSHPDLADRAWKNPGESGGGKETNGVDDDANGYVDDVNGWDFHHDDKTVHDPGEDAHGTHVSGTIAASANNQSVVGVAPNIQVMSLKFLGPHGGFTSDAVEALEYAKRKGVKISNNSWGGGAYSQALKDAIEASGQLFVAAAGNSARDSDVTPAYPASYGSPNILSVAAVSNQGNLASFSNYGATTVDVSAPGVSILSSVPAIPDIPAVILSSVGSSGKAITAGFGADGIGDSAKRASFFTRAFAAVGRGSEQVVLVDDDLSYTGYYPDVAPALSTAIQSATGSVPEKIEVGEYSDGPDLPRLSGRTVVWATGRTPFSQRCFFCSNPLTNLTANDQQTLTDFLNGGGKLVLTGMDALYLIEYSPFVTSTLGLGVQRDAGSSVNATSIKGSSGTAFGGESYALDSSTAYARYHDKVMPVDPSAVSQGVYPNDVPYSWQYLNGTSMAAPHATGVAALAASKSSDLLYDPTELKGVVMNSGKPVPSTVGKTATGDIVDAAAALRATAFTVGNVAPAENAKGVVGTTNITARFVGEVDPATLDTSTFTLTEQEGSTPPLGATVSYDAATRIATLDPNENLETDNAYTATIKGGPNGVKDAAGNALLRDKIWTFSTVDTRPPSAPVITSPANNSIDADGYFTLSGTAEIGSTVELFEGDASAGTTLVNASGQWSKYFSSVAEGPHTYTARARDAAGNTSDPSDRLTVDVRIPPRLISVSPANGTQNVVRGTDVEATFSEAMDKASLENPGTFTLTQGTSQVEATVAYDAATNKATLDPNSGLAWNATYTATIKGGSSGAKDTAGNALGQDHSWTFATTNDPAAPITTHELSPQPNPAGWNDSNVTVTLNATDTGGSRVKEIRYSATGAQSIAQTVYDPQNPPVIETEGTTTISYFATDNAGNRESPVKTFTVRLDKSAPTLDTDNSDGADGVTPDKGQTGVRRNSNPTATSSDPMDQASLRTSAMLYQWDAQKKAWQEVPTRVGVSGKTATLDPYPSAPTRLLAANKRFKVTVTTGAKNLAGLSMASPKSWIFTTGTR